MAELAFSAASTRVVIPAEARKTTADRSTMTADGCSASAPRIATLKWGAVSASMSSDTESTSALATLDCRTSNAPRLGHLTIRIAATRPGFDHGSTSFPARNCTAGTALTDTTELEAQLRSRCRTPTTLAERPAPEQRRVLRADVIVNICAANWNRASTISPDARIGPVDVYAKNNVKIVGHQDGPTRDAGARLRMRSEPVATGDRAPGAAVSGGAVRPRRRGRVGSGGVGRRAVRVADWLRRGRTRHRPRARPARRRLRRAFGGGDDRRARRGRRTRPVRRSWSCSPRRRDTSTTTAIAADSRAPTSTNCSTRWKATTSGGRRRWRRSSWARPSGPNSTTN